MEAFGFLLAAANLILGLLLPIFRSNDDLLIRATSVIRDEFAAAYREFGNYLSAEGVDLTVFGNCIERMKKLHYASVDDICRIKKLELWIPRGTKIAISLMVVSSASLAYTFVVPDKDFILSKNVFLVGIPLSVFCCQLLVLLMMLRGEKFLKGVNSRYSRMEY